MIDSQKAPKKNKMVEEALNFINRFVKGDKDDFLLYQCPQCGKWLCCPKQDIVSRTFDASDNTGIVMSEKCNNLFTKYVSDRFGKAVGILPGLFDWTRGDTCSQCNKSIILVLADLKNTGQEFENKIEECRKSYSNLSDNPSELINLLRFYSSIRDLPDEIKSKVFGSIVQPEELKHEYLKNFLKIKQEDRQLLVFKDNLDIFPNKGCVVLPLRNPPKGLSFGKQRRPDKDAIYMLHPHKDYEYILAKSYLDVVFEDKLRELKKLLNAWGAEKINIINETVKKEETNASNSIAQKFKGVCNGVPVDGESSRMESDEKSYSIAQKVEIEIHNNPTPNLPPYLPDDLVWYPHEQEWRDNYKARTERTNFMKYHAYYSEQRSKENVEEEKASLSVSGLGISQDSLKEYEEASISKRDITVEVKFYPMEIYRPEKKHFKLFSK